MRSPFRIIANLVAYKQLLTLMTVEKFDLVHCHTPMGGVLGRLAAKETKTAPVIYTAHGFHFFKGAPLYNWLLFYPIEKILAHYTDILITINNEDYIRARKFILRRNGTLENVNGIGIRTQEMKKPILKEDFCHNLGISKDSFIITSVGELTRRKNHKVVIKALAKMNHSLPVVYIICGTGSNKGKLEKLAKRLNMSNKVLFLGYRQDIKDILSITDCFVFPSLQEGLPVALMEAMAVGLPIICSKVRGNIDLIENFKGGFLVRAKSSREYASAINKIVLDKKLRKDMGAYNKNIIKKYSIESINKKMKDIYSYIDSKIIINQERVVN